MKIALLLANGFEEVEAITPLDILRRAEIIVETIGIGGKEIKGAHNITVCADITECEAKISDYDAVILPGGMPGTTNLDKSSFVSEIIDSVDKKGGRIAAICAAPMILGRRGLLKGKNAICYPGFEEELKGAKISSDGVVTDGNVTTARDMHVALEFGLELARLLLCKTTVSENKNQPKKEKAAESNYLNYSFPSIDLLNKVDKIIPENLEEETRISSELLINTLEFFNYRAKITKIERGPRITRYSIIPAKGIIVNQIERLADDLALAMAADSIRIEAPVPGKSAIGIEIPNKIPSVVSLRELIQNDEFANSQSCTTVCLGKTVEGNPVFNDIKKLPHLLISGATGMGKSVCINSIITSILYKARPDEVKFILIDPKKVEFSLYNDIPHLLVPVITEPSKAAGSLLWAVDEMNRRYELIEKLSLRTIDAYNEKVTGNPELGIALPKIIIVIDELNDLMRAAREPIENLIMLIAQKSRAVGIHMIIGTQRPSVNVITGVIKANIPARIACRVVSAIDSRTILDVTGAEKLIGKGDMLFQSPDKPYPIRVQGAYISDIEIAKITEHIKKQSNESIYNDQIIQEIDDAAKTIKI